MSWSPRGCEFKAAKFWTDLGSWWVVRPWSTNNFSLTNCGTIYKNIFFQQGVILCLQADSKRLKHPMVWTEQVSKYLQQVRSVNFWMVVKCINNVFFIPMNEMHLYFTFTHMNIGYCKFSLTYKHFISHKKVLFEPFHQLEWMNEWIIAPKKNQTRPNKMKIQFFFRNCWS